MSNEKINVGREPVYDARKLGYGKMGILGFQHMFAMFGATVTVPLLTGLNVQTTLLMAGLGTLLFHLLTRFKVPAFLGSSFAFIGGYLAIACRWKWKLRNASICMFRCCICRFIVPDTCIGNETGRCFKSYETFSTSGNRTYYYCYWVVFSTISIK